MCRCVEKMSDVETRSPLETFSGEGGEGEGGGDGESTAVACPSPGSEDDAGGEKRAVANSIFQACTAYRQNLVNQLQADVVSYKATVLALGAAFGFLVLCVSVVVFVIYSLWDGGDRNEASAKDDNKSGLFVLDLPHPDGSIGKEFDLYGSARAFAEDLFLDEEASPQEPKNASGLEDSYLNVLDAI
ncbi:hypothetical protein HPB50_002997 [Hyalomma asiaticum]|uniref:Uncharacterized protein n=1 Tax=Hyalomma asiaticum TaxID=266040 RepID=A0ACB7SIS1_HYAAI|nr:hypothetical protein HPB50_002997 [Hyalomma asiaticum]